MTELESISDADLELLQSAHMKVDNAKSTFDFVMQHLTKVYGLNPQQAISWSGKIELLNVGPQLVDGDYDANGITTKAANPPISSPDSPSGESDSAAI